MPYRVSLALLLVAWGCGPADRPSELPQTASIFLPDESSRIGTDAGATRGVGWADFDQDGDVDLVTANTNGQWNALYRNERPPHGARSGSPESATPSGRVAGFLKVSEPSSPLGAVASAGGRAESVSWVDIDGDGDLDLHMVTRGEEPDLLFENRGPDGLARVGEGMLVRARSHTMACWADVDRDGWLDVFLVGYRSEAGNVLLRNLGGWAFESIGEDVFAGGSRAGRSCTWGDPDDDGLPDLYVGNAREPNDLFWNRGDLSFERDVTGGHLVEHIGYSYGLSWADSDGDGDQDLFVANFDTVNVLYRNDGSGRLDPVTSSPIATEAGGASKGHTWGDYDLDGDLDLFIANGTYGPDMRNFLYLSEGDGFTRVSGGPLEEHADTSAGAAWADYDRDGDLDMFVANWGGSDQPNRLYRNTTAERTGRAWIRFTLRGASPNTFAWGARVRVRATLSDGPRWMTRWHVPTTGYASQNELVVHFGLDRAERVDSVVVRWPSGREQHLGAREARREWRLEEPGHVTIIGAWSRPLRPHDTPSAWPLSAPWWNSGRASTRRSPSSWAATPRRCSTRSASPTGSGCSTASTGSQLPRARDPESARSHPSESRSRPFAYDTSESRRRTSSVRAARPAGVRA